MANPLTQEQVDWLIWRFRQDNFPIDMLINGGEAQRAMWGLVQEMFAEKLAEKGTYPSAYQIVKNTLKAAFEKRILEIRENPPEMN